jgi:hypothetical protein
MRRVLLLVVLAGVAAQAAPAKPTRKPAKPAETKPEAEQSHLARARELSRTFEFEAALTELEFALAQKPTKAEREEILSLRGVAWAALDSPDKAAEAFAELLTSNPAWTPGASMSPKVREAFTKGQALWESRQVVELEVAPPVVDESGIAFEVRVKKAVRRVADVALFYRVMDGEASFASVGLVRNGEGLFSVKLPPVRQGSARRVALGYHVRANDLGGQPVGTAGAPNQPLTIEVQTLAAEAAPVPVYKSWVFWTAVGVVAVGAAASPFIIQSATTPPVPNGSLGQVKLQ